MHPEEADPTVRLELDATAGPSPIWFGFTDQHLTATDLARRHFWSIGLQPSLEKPNPIAPPAIT